MQNSLIGSLLSLPSRYWALGATLAQTVFDAGIRSAQKEQAIATYDAAVAQYRQTVLGAFQDVEDNLAALTLLAREAAEMIIARMQGLADRKGRVVIGGRMVYRESACAPDRGDGEQ